MDNTELLYKMVNDRFDAIGKEIKEVKADVKEIRAQVATLNTFKAKVVGFASCATFLGSIAGWAISTLIK